MGRHAVAASDARPDVSLETDARTSAAALIAAYGRPRAAAASHSRAAAASHSKAVAASHSKLAAEPGRRHRGPNAAALIAALSAEHAATSANRSADGSHFQQPGSGAVVSPAASHPVAKAHSHAAPPWRDARCQKEAGAPRRPHAGRLTAALDWRMPARTPLYLAGVVALTVVVTDQTGVFSGHGTQATAVSAVAATVTPTSTPTGSATGNGLAGRVSRSDRRAELAASAATVSAATPVPAPTPTSTMKPGQTVDGTWVIPSTGPYVSCFCNRWGTFHEGIDLAGPLGSPVLAVGDGTVIDAGPASGFGNWVVVQHSNGDVTIYGHMRYYYVKVGQQVTAGQEIALVGAEGQVTGPHLHLGVRVGGPNGPYVDPVGWLAARGVQVGAYGGS